jgi:hypothetical protein
VAKRHHELVPLLYRDDVRRFHYDEVTLFETLLVRGHVFSGGDYRAGVRGTREKSSTQVMP